MPLYLGKDKITNVIYTDTGTKEGELNVPSIDENGLITSSVKKQGYMFASDKFNTTLQLPKNPGGVVNPSAETTQVLAGAGEYMVEDLILPSEPDLNENNILSDVNIYNVIGQIDFAEDAELNTETLEVKVDLVNKQTNQTVRSVDYSLLDKITTAQDGIIFSPTPESAEKDIEIISEPTYILGKGYIKKEENLIPSNIKLGTSIYGVEGTLKSSIPPIENSWPNNDRPLSTSTTLYFEGVEAIPKYMNIFCWGSSPDNEYDPNGSGATGTVMMDYISQSISQSAFVLSLNYSQEKEIIKGNSIIGGIESSWTAFFYGFHVFEYDSESKILTIKLKDLTREEVQEMGGYNIVFFSSEEYKYYLNYSF